MNSKIIQACGEKVMGWQIFPMGNQLPRDITVAALVETVTGSWRLHLPHGPWAGQPWDPTTSISDAFMLVDKLLEPEGKDFYLEYEGIRVGGWMASFGTGGAVNLACCMAIAEAALREVEAWN